MSSVYLCPLTTNLQYFTNAGLVLNGGKIATYLAGTSTPQATYTDSTGVTPNANPIILNSAGGLPNVQIWLPAGVAIKAVISDANNNVLQTLDQLSGMNDPTSVVQTFFAGTDSGSSNVYVLNNVAGFNVYTNGQVVYWIPANTNSTSSTININGLGNISIVNPDGTNLLTGYINAGQVTTIAIYGGKAILLSSIPTAFSAYTGTVNGLTAFITGPVFYRRTGHWITHYVTANIQGTSNAAQMTLTGMPASTRPVSLQVVASAGMLDNGASAGGTAAVGTGGVVVFGNGIAAGASGGGFTATGIKGLAAGWSISYSVI